MTSTALHESLAALKGNSVSISGRDANEDFYSIFIEFSNGTTMKADYWRVIQKGKHPLSSFDHKQKYGLSVPIDAIAAIKKELDGKIASQVQFQKETGDIVLVFSNDLKLQILNFTGYEVWQINFPDGTCEYSNYARKYD